MSEDLELSDLGRASQDLFVSEYASHIFYVEDSNAEAFYEKLFQLFFPNLTTFEVVCLGGKTKVEAKAKERRVADLTYVFLVDKDFDDLLDITPNPDLTYLDRYSIENYLSDTVAILKVLVEESDGKFTLLQAKRACSDHAEYRENLENRLIETTRYFVLARRYALELQTSKLSPDELIEGCNEWHPMPTEEWIKAYREKVLEMSGLPQSDLDEELSSALESSAEYFNGTKLLPLFHVPGKHLLRCLLQYVAIRTSSTFEDRIGKSLHSRLLNHVNLKEFAFLKDRLISKYPNLEQMK